MFPKSKITLPLLALPLLFCAAVSLHADFFAVDPGVRGDPAGAGGPIDGISDNERKFFEAGLEAFNEIQDVQGDDPGLGPRFNLDNCAGCHAQPAVGGSSPFTNPQVAVATKANAKNVVPFFIRIDGPVREARFKFKPNGTRDGGVHALFTITGRDDAPGCFLDQPDFATAAAQNNLIFRIPTPTFGAGLIQAIDEDTILANKRSHALRKQFFGIAGRENRNANDGSITRFGWKAQNKSLLIFAGEAYNVEQGVTNELFPQERDETPECLFNGTPEDQTRFDETELTAVPSDTAKFAIFMRFLAPPTPTAETPSISNGRSLFDRIGCSLCHTPSLTTGKSSNAAFDQKRVKLFSDLLLHNMGPGLADDILQGNARGDEFRTAPLWGLGQRKFFLHDGRTTDLREAIMAHRSFGNLQFGSSEANLAIQLFDALGRADTQDIFNFLRSL
jgi:CxxC motif-containing protein (DUF1111 family)